MPTAAAAVIIIPVVEGVVRMCVLNVSSADDDGGCHSIHK